MAMKTCTKCGADRSVLDGFYRCATSKDGLDSWCKSCKRAVNKRWHDANVDRHRQMNRDCYKKHKPQKHARRMERIKTDPKVRLIHNLRARLHAALGGDKIAPTKLLLGCTVEELKIHLEKQFQPGMTWDNYGTWHVDHKTAMAKIDVNDPTSIASVCHYTNLQPLWAVDNLSKGAR